MITLLIFINLFNKIKQQKIIFLINNITTYAVSQNKIYYLTANYFSIKQNKIE